VDEVSVPKKADLKAEVLRTILRESLNRYRNELLEDEERQVLRDRILRLRRLLGLAGSL
jgi:hypothetical protein